MWRLSASRSLFSFVVLLATLHAGCAKSSSTTIGAPSGGAATQMVFDAVVPSVVAVLNDDRAIREDEQSRSGGFRGAWSSRGSRAAHAALPRLGL